MAEKKTQVDNLNTSHTAVKDKQSELQSALSNSEELLQTLLTGLTSNEKNKTGGGYMGQLADARSRVAQAVSEHEQRVMKRANTDKELKKLQDRWKEVEREAGDGRKQLQKMQTDVEKFRKAVAATGWTAEREQQVEDALREARSHLRQCTEVLSDNFSILDDANSVVEP